MEYKVGDLVTTDGFDGDLYMYLGRGVWDGWGWFLNMSGGNDCQMPYVTCKRWKYRPDKK